MPDAPKGLVSENNITKMNRTSGLAQPAQPAILTAIVSSALAIRSILTAVVGPARSRNAPAMGLIAKPGTIAANVSHPAKTGDEKRVRANKTRVRENIRPAKRDMAVARISAGNPRTSKRAR